MSRCPDAVLLPVRCSRHLQGFSTEPRSAFVRSLHAVVHAVLAVVLGRGH